MRLNSFAKCSGESSDGEHNQHDGKGDDSEGSQSSEDNVDFVRSTLLGGAHPEPEKDTPRKRPAPSASPPASKRALPTPATSSVKSRKTGSVSSIRRNKREFCSCPGSPKTITGTKERQKVQVR